MFKLNFNTVCRANGQKRVVTGRTISTSKPVSHPNRNKKPKNPLRQTYIVKHRPPKSTSREKSLKKRFSSKKPNNIDNRLSIYKNSARTTRNFEHKQRDFFANKFRNSVKQDVSIELYSNLVRSNVQYNKNHINSDAGRDKDNLYESTPPVISTLTTSQINNCLQNDRDLSLKRKKLRVG